MNRDETLNTAQNMVTGARKTTYGDAKEHFTKVALLWEQVLGVKVEPHQVPICLSLLKIARLSETPGHGDSWVDIAGYAALGAEVATAETPSFSNVIGGTSPVLATSSVPIVGNFIADQDDDPRVTADEVRKKVRK